MDKAHISFRIPATDLQAVDRIVLQRRIDRTPGRGATRSAVVTDLIKRGLTSGAAEQKETDQ